MLAFILDLILYRITYSMRQDTSQMSKETLIDSQDTLCADRLIQAIEHALVKVTCLVVHASHDSVYKEKSISKL